MSSRRIPVLALACGLLAAAGPAWPQVAASSPANGRDVRSWLVRIQEAATRQNFQGTFVISGGGNVASARMAHFCEGSNQYERIESLDGQARNVYRWNDIVHTLWPANRVAVIEPRDPLNSFPAVLQAGDDALAEWYDVQPQGADRIAGRDADVLLVRPKDTYRYGYRLWADKPSGLLLRADVLGERGQVLETSAFSDITIGQKAQPETVLQPMKRLDAYRVVRPTSQSTRLEAEGWVMRQVAPGFRLVSCVNRQMESPADAEAAGGAQRVLQAIYADGLTYVSVFVEPFRPERHTRPMLASVGATQTLSMRQGDWWITVVGDVPAATLKMFANGLERRK
ncbi:MAG TPA: MucB/RseB C-terminal domain-containing protein [Caldimonas sp.]|nr:MucB/RseB C-terminal domain-containing protein [Caldimonas sp.]